MYKFFLALLISLSLTQFSFVSAKQNFPADDPRLSILKQHVIAGFLEASVSEAGIKKLAGSMSANGSWSDIDYTDKTRGGWSVAGHLSRLLDMAVAFNKNGSALKSNPDLNNKINAGINFWLKNDFICPNWWYPEIGVPRLLGPIMLLQEDRLSSEQKEAGIKILERAKIGMTGQNRVWLSGNVIYRSLLTGNYNLIEEAASAIKDEVVVSEAEGIQADNSFHQHGPQQQFGNYGSAFAADILKWGIIFRDTPFQFSAEKTTILSDYLLKGMRWIIWKNQMDISACGRQLFPHSQKGKARDVAGTIRKMPLLNPDLKDQYLTALDDFNGDIHFWKSDMTVHRRTDFYTSVKMSSSRVAGAESCNSENVQGYHLGDGATYFYQSGNEYTDIFPFWDWKRIPGTTVFHDEAPLPVLPCSGYLINSDFVGGVSDGMNGIATLAYKRDGLNAQKSWFFFDDATICLGAGINSDENKEVNTTVNQSFLHGEVAVKEGGKQRILNPGTHNLKDVNWIIHDEWGYFFPEKPSLELTNRTQSGNWNNVLKRMPPKEEKAGIFTLWFNHSVKPAGTGYAYYVFPRSSPAIIERKAAQIRLIANTGAVQAAESLSNSIAGFVFVKAGSSRSGLSGLVSTDKPAVIMISKANAGFNVTVSDPAHKESVLTIGLEGNRKSSLFPGNYDTAKNMTYFIVKLPAGPEAGRSINFVAGGK